VFIWKSQGIRSKFILLSLILSAFSISVIHHQYDSSLRLHQIVCHVVICCGPKTPSIFLNLITFYLQYLIQLCVIVSYYSYAALAFMLPLLEAIPLFTPWVKLKFKHTFLWYICCTMPLIFLDVPVANITICTEVLITRRARGFDSNSWLDVPVTEECYYFFKIIIIDNRCNCFKISIFSQEIFYLFLHLFGSKAEFSHQNLWPMTS